MTTVCPLELTLAAARFDMAIGRQPDDFLDRYVCSAPFPVSLVFEHHSMAFPENPPHYRVCVETPDGPANVDVLASDVHILLHGSGQAG